MHGDLTRDLYKRRSQTGRPVCQSGGIDLTWPFRDSPCSTRTTFAIYRLIVIDVLGTPNLVHILYHLSNACSMSVGWSFVQ